MNAPTGFNTDGTLPSNTIIHTNTAATAVVRAFTEQVHQQIVLMLGGAFLSIGGALFLYGQLLAVARSRGIPLSKKAPAIKSLERVLSEAIESGHYSMFTFQWDKETVTMQVWRQSRHTSGHPYGVVFEAHVLVD